jgi:hypothetical protein
VRRFIHPGRQRLQLGSGQITGSMVSTDGLLPAFGLNDQT